MPQQIGVQAIVDTTSLGSGVNAYLAALNRMVAETNAAAKKLAIQGPTIDLTKSVKSFSAFDREIDALNKKLSSFRNSISNVSNDLQRMSAMGASGASVGFAAGIGAAIGTASIDAIKAVLTQLQAMSAEVIDQIGYWERLGLSVRFFAAEAARARDPTLSVADSMKQVQQESEATVLWIQKLGILSPFTAQQVASIYRVAIGYGMTTDAAQELLPALVDLGSVAGLAPDVLERVSLALAQVAARGKLTGEEVRQLGNAGVPIRDMLVKQLGIANDQFDDLLESGAFLSGIVIPAVIKSLQKFDGAAEAASMTTITGLISMIQEVGQLGVAKFFGSAAEEIKTQLAEIAGILSDVNFFAALEVIGKDVGKLVSDIINQITIFINSMIAAWNALDPVTKETIYIFAGAVLVFTAFTAAVSLLNAAIMLLINPFTIIAFTVSGFVAMYTSNFANVRTTTDNVIVAITTAFGKLATEVSTFATNVTNAVNNVMTAFSNAASEAISWGTNIVNSLADGIVAATDMIMQALSVVGQAIAYMLQPGSPPRLLPDLDKWGTEAANVWLQGWTEADFDILGSITDDMRNVLTATMGAKGGGQIDVINTVIGSRQYIADAIDQIRNFGSVTQKTLDQIRQATGSASEAVIGVIERYASLANATNVVNAIQEKLTQITTKYTAALKPLQDRLKAISETRQQADEQKEIIKLQRVLASANASNSRKQEAAMRLEEIQAQQKVRSLEAQRDAALASGQTQLTAAQKIQEEAQTQLDIFRKRIDAQNEEGQLVQERLRLELQLANAAGQLNQKKAEGLTPLEKALKLAQLQQAELQDQIELAKARLVLEDSTATAAEKAAAQLKIQEITLSQQVRDLEAAKLGGSVAAMREIPIVLEDIKKKTGKESPFKDLVTDVENLQKTKIDEAFKEYKTAIDNFTLSWNTNKKTISDSIDAIDKTLPSFLQLKDAAGGVPPILKSLSVAFVAIGAALATSQIIGVISGMAAAISAIGVAASAAIGVVVAIAIAAVAWYQNWFGIQETVAAAVVNIQAWIDQFLLSIQMPGLQTLLTNVQNAFIGLQNSLNGIFLSIQTSFGQLTTFLQSVDVQSALANIYTLFLNFFQGIKGLLSNGFQYEDVGNAITLFVNTIFAALQRLSTVPYIGEFAANVATALSDLRDTLRESGITGFFDYLIEGAKKAAAAFGSFAVIAPFLSLFVNVGNDIKNTFAGIVAASSVFKSAFAINFIGVFKDVYMSVMWFADAFVNLFANAIDIGIFAVKMFRTAISPLQKVIGTLTGLFYGGGQAINDFGFSLGNSLVSAFKVFLSSGKSVLTIFKSIGLGIKALLSPTVIFGILFDFALNQIIKYWGPISQFFSELWGWIVKLGQGLGKAFGAFIPALQGLMDGTKKGQATWEKFWTDLWQFLVDWTALVGNWMMTKVLPALTIWVQGLPNEIWQYIVMTINGIVQFLRWGAGLFNQYIIPWVQAFVGWVVLVWPTVAGYLNDFLLGLWQWIIDTGLWIWTQLSTVWVPQFVGWVAEVWPTVAGYLNDFIVQLAGWILFAATLIPRFLLQWIPVFAQWVVSVWPNVQTGLIDFWNSLVAWVVSTASSLGVLMQTQFLPYMWNWIQNSVMPALAQLGTWIWNILAWLLTQGLPMLLTGMLDFATALVGWIGDAAAFALPALGEFIGKIMAWIITDGIPGIVKGVAGLGLALWGWISGNAATTPQSSAWGKVGEALWKFLGKITEVITLELLPALVKTAINFGSELVAGIAKGIADNVYKIKDGLNGAIDGSIDWLKDQLGIKSPSTVMADTIGAPMAAGVVQGFTNSDFSAMADAVVSGVISKLEEMGSSVQTSVVTHFNMMRQGAVNEMGWMRDGVGKIAGNLGLLLWSKFRTVWTDARQYFKWTFEDGLMYFGYLKEGSIKRMSDMGAGILDQIYALKMMLLEDDGAVIPSIRDGVINAMGTMATLSIVIVSSMADTIVSLLDNKTGLVARLNSEFVPEGLTLGQNFAHGIENGITSQINAIAAAAAAVVTAAINAARNAANEHSPSRETRDKVGIPFAQGIAVGIQQASGEVLKASQDLIGGLLGDSAYAMGQSFAANIANGIRAGSTSIAGAINSFAPGGVTMPQMVSATINSAPSQMPGMIVNNYSRVNNYNLNLTAGRDARSLASEFKTMEIMAL